MLSEIIDKRDGESLVADVAIRIFHGVHKGWILQIIPDGIEFIRYRRFFFVLFPLFSPPSGAGLKTFISPSPDWSVSRRFITFFRPLLIGPYLTVLSLFLFNLFKAFNAFKAFNVFNLL